MILVIYSLPVLRIEEFVARYLFFFSTLKCKCDGSDWFNMAAGHNVVVAKRIQTCQLTKKATGCQPFNLSHHTYCQISNTSRTLAGNNLVDHSDVVGASPVSAAPTTSSCSTWHLASIDCAKTPARCDKNHLTFGIWWPYIRDFMVVY